MARFVHERHKPPATLDRPRELVIACAPLRSNVNLSRIVRTAGCFALTKVIACGNAKIDREIARDGADSVQLDKRRTLGPVLKQMQQEGYRLIGLEQTTNSVSLYEFQFPRKAVFVLGNEREGITEDILELLDDVVEIPVYGLPYSFNVATAATIAMYEYCRQFPRG